MVCCGCGCFEVVVDSGSFAATTSWMLEACSVSEGIDSRLGLVIIPKRLFAQK